ncbi:MAG TPA: octaprenyl diphosphate synthase [Gammaproteobacteria bacterium]|nr:octaprenyl diphosphate synthase [Gammaproteobacteria bacterium]
MFQTPKAAPEPSPLDAIRSVVADDLPRVDQVIRDRLQSDVALIDQVSHYIVNSGGKRLRPLLVLIAARACEYRGDRHAEAAAIIEFIHTATLLHDDVVDASALRRGQDTANTVWGNQASVLVGDFLYSRAFQMMVDIGEMRVMDVLAEATNTIAEGEVLQLHNCHDPNTTEDRYLQVIYRKTAKLFEAGVRIAAILADRSPEIELALVEYGRRLGNAFQLVDDALDYSASSEALGKNVGADLAEGKPTLPLIHAMSEGTAAQRSVIRDAIERSGRARLREVTQAIESTRALEYTAAFAQRESAAALAALVPLPESKYKDALKALAEFAVERRI